VRQSALRLAAAAGRRKRLGTTARPGPAPCGMAQPCAAAISPYFSTHRMFWLHLAPLQP
jgi:hypothetical protein